MRRARRVEPSGKPRSAPAAPHGLSVPKLPHERDETPDPDPGPQRPPIAQAAKDVAVGRVDTDCYGAARRAFERGRSRRSR